MFSIPCFLKMRIVWFLNRACRSASFPSGAVYVRSSNMRALCACAIGSTGTTPRATKPRTNAAPIATAPYSFFMTRSFTDSAEERILGIVADNRGPFADSPFRDDSIAHIRVRLRERLCGCR